MGVGGEGGGAESGAPGMAAPADAERFRLELEFVQCLANPGYLHRATPPPVPNPSRLIALPLGHGQFCSGLHPVYGPDAERAPPSFPQCLVLLELLQRPAFRAALADKRSVDWLQQQQYHHWLSGEGQERYAEFGVWGGTSEVAGAGAGPGGDGGPGAAGGGAERADGSGGTAAKAEPE